MTSLRTLDLCVGGWSASWLFPVETKTEWPQLGRLKKGKVVSARGKISPLAVEENP